MKSKLFIIALLCSAFSLAGEELKVGDMAPDFTLPATDGKIYTLADFRGKQAVVLAWFPKAYTRGCTIECKSLAENGHLIREYNVAYFMASVDELEDNSGFAEENKANFPLLSDPEKTVAEAYDVLIPVVRVPNRHTFYIGVDGTILKIDKDVVPKSSAEDMARTLGELGIEKIGAGAES